MIADSDSNRLRTVEAIRPDVSGFAPMGTARAHQHMVGQQRCTRATLTRFSPSRSTTGRARFAQKRGAAFALI
jgi:hypothetical protein